MATPGSLHRGFDCLGLRMVKKASSVTRVYWKRGGAIINRTVLTPDQWPLLVLQHGRPVLASSSIGSALQEATLQNLLNVLDFGMDPPTAARQPNTRGPFYGSSLNGPFHPAYDLEAIGEGDFSQTVLDGVRARGQAIRIVSRNEQAGHWIGIQIDPRTGRLSGGVTSRLNAAVEGY